MGKLPEQVKIHFMFWPDSLFVSKSVFGAKLHFQSLYLCFKGSNVRFKAGRPFLRFRDGQFSIAQFRFYGFQFFLDNEFIFVNLFPCGSAVSQFLF